MLIQIFALIIRVVWIAIEFPYLRRHRTEATQDWDKQSGKFWDLANLIEPVGFVLAFAGIGTIKNASTAIRITGLVLLIVGIVIRGSAIRALGKYFTTSVVIKTDHRLIRHGLYKYLRHPAYTGTLMAHLGLGVAFANWFSLVLSTVPFFIAALYRMHVEDRALRETFGDEYVLYSASTKRLIPMVY